MSAAPTDPIDLLAAARRGEASAAERLVPLVYDRLRSVASGLLRRERRDHTLQPTALVHEAWLQLVDVEGLDADDAVAMRRQFVSLAARQMRRVLVDHARASQRLKRGGGFERVELPGELPVRELDVATLLDLEDALQGLSMRSARLAQVAELRLFGGLGSEEIGALLGMRGGAVREEWTLARAMLSRSLRAGG